MIEYGEDLGEYSPNEDYYRDLLCEYFDSPVMKKVKDVKEMSIYACKVHSMLSVDKRYIICNKKLDNFPIGYKTPLKDISWECLQTRAKNIPNYDTGVPHRYSIKKTENYRIPLYLEKREPASCTYRTSNDTTLCVTLLTEGKTPFIYGNEGNMVSALETYATLVSFKK